MFDPPQSELATALAKLIKVSNSNVQYESKVNSVLNIACWELDLDLAVLLTLNRDQEQLVPMWRADTASQALSPLPLDGNMVSRSLAMRQILLAEKDDLNGFSADWQQLIASYNNSFLAAPLSDDKTVYGALVLLGKNPYQSTPARTLFLEAVTNELTIAIKSFQLATDTRKRLSVLNVLSDLGRTLSSTIDAEKVMAMIPQIATGIFLADACTLNILDESGRELLMSSQHGPVPPSCNFERYRGSKAPLPQSVSQPLSLKTSFSGYLKDLPKAPELSDSEMEYTIITCPLTFQGPHQGTISLFNKLAAHDAEGIKAPRLFDRDDLELLFSMNNIISGVLENAITFREVAALAQTNEKMVTYLSALYDISSAMMTTVRYDELVWIITRALTDREGLAFDQVLIFLLHDSETGPPTLNSSAFWSCKQNTGGAVGEQKLAEILKSPLREEAALMLKRGREMGLKIPVYPENSRIFSRVILEKKPMLGFRLFNSENDADLQDFGFKTYAAVPMLAKNQKVGVIAVDRSLSEEPLTKESLRDLTMLANQAGLAIESVRLYDSLAQANHTLAQVRGQLIEAEKVAAQGEMGAQLAHEVRNPLVSIGGFTQRLLKKMSDDDPLKKYAHVIWEEVERLNKVLNNVLDFSRNEAGLVSDFRMEDLMAETISSLRHELTSQKVQVETKVEPGLPCVTADSHQVMHIFLNLFYNAAQAMAPKGGKVFIKIFLANRGDQAYVTTSLTDTGPGIPQDILPYIFNPFYTSKADGSGLGLSIAKKIADRYHGFLTVENHPEFTPGSGASFTLMLPAAQSGGLRA